jgi:hypothetical protein
LLRQFLRDLLRADGKLDTISGLALTGVRKVPEIAAVTQPGPDPKAGKPKPKSDIGFPYYSLDRSIEVARLLHERAGGRCGRSQLATLLDYSGVKNGGFLTRISAAKMFGLIEEYGDAISLTERAKKILAPIRPVDADKAKVEAFMAVELFRRVFDDFDGHTLPAEVGLRNKFQNEYKIVPKQVPNALRCLLESADSAGMFKLAGNRSRLIAPILNGATVEDAGAQPETLKERPSDTQADTQNARTGGGNGGGGGGGDGDLPGVHPALAGLVQNLPPVGSKLGPKRRNALIDAFKSTINFLYPEDEE